ncbi:PfkB family carbohydrate kinase [Vibrio diazotrophicus]|uniref:PfkB family carbohydrate kinase n=1 Tax=Vibrio diazotrophicus TaxID=685 RepID=UPI001FE7FCC2|nr:PfkB family carbohydrate kinase [Vibrio diazotrophicus]
MINGHMFVTPREQQILAILRENPMIQQQELADQLMISRSAIAGHIMNLTNKGLIKGKGYILASQKTAIVIGGANMDLCGKASVPLLNGDSNPGTLHYSPGGVARNIADNLARLGSKVELISSIGNDQWGEQLVSACIDAGVGVSHLLRCQQGRTATYLSIHDNEGEMQIALNDMKVLEQLNAEQLTKHKSLISHSDLVVIDANLSEDALSYLFNCIDNTRIYVDPVSANKALKLKPYLSQIDLLKPNLIEAELLSGIKVTSEDDYPRICDALHHLGVKEVVLSLGSKGIFASNQKETFRLKPRTTSVTNVTGAGDALMAGLAHATLEMWSWKKSIEFAFSCAELATQSYDTINPRMSDRAVQRLMEINHAE